MRTAVAVLLASTLMILLPTAQATNCPPNALHCQVNIGLGTAAYAEVEFGVEAVYDVPMEAALTQVDFEASLRLWARAQVMVNATNTTARLTIDANASTPGILWSGPTQRVLVANLTQQEVDFPFTLDPDITPGDVLFIPVSVSHEDGSFASTHVPLQVGRALVEENVVDQIVAAWPAVLVGLFAGGGVGWVIRDVLRRRPPL